MKRLEHPRGFLAAGDTEIEARLGLGGDRFRIVLAIESALTAILRSHWRNHAPAQRAAFRQLHAIGNWQSLTMPWRLVMLAIGGRALQNRLALLRREGRRAIRRQQSGEESVQPGSLRFGERRTCWDDFDFRRRGHLVHVEGSASASLRRVPASWRRAKLKNGSSAERRWAKYAFNNRSTALGASVAGMSR